MIIVSGSDFFISVIIYLGQTEDLFQGVLFAVPITNYRVANGLSLRGSQEPDAAIDIVLTVTPLCVCILHTTHYEL